jgi:hypothetical protein
MEGAIDAAQGAVDRAMQWFSWVSGTETPTTATVAATEPQSSAGCSGGTASIDIEERKPSVVSSAQAALQRVKSFSSSPHADAWRDLPVKMGPVAMVRAGWRACKPDAELLTVQCDTCGAELEVPDAPSWTSLTLEAAVDEFAELMQSTHAESCPWRVRARARGKQYRKSGNLLPASQPLTM